MEAPPDGATGDDPGAGRHNTTSCGQVAERLRRLDTAVESVQVTDDKLLTPAVAPFSLSDEDNDLESPVAWRARLGTLAPCLAIFCFSLDSTVIAIAIPRITDEFHAVQDIGWYGSSYLLTVCAVQLIYGTLYSFYSIKAVYFVSVLLHSVGTLICGAAPSSVAFIVGRAVTGLGGAGLFTGSYLIVHRTVPIRWRPAFLGLLAGIYGVASVMGLLLGGVFIDRLTWRWCFYVSLPSGAVCLLFIFFFLQVDSPKSQLRIQRGSITQQLRRFDIEGTLCFVPGIISLLLALQWGGTTYAWSDGHIIGLLILCFVLLFAFLSIQLWKQGRATIPPRVFRNRTLWASFCFIGCLNPGLVIVMSYLPLWFQGVQGSSAFLSSIKLLPLILGLVVFALVAGALVGVCGYYTPFLMVSSVCMATGSGFLSTLRIHSGAGAWIGYQCLFGFGIGFGIQQPVLAVQTSLEPEHVAIGTALIQISQNLGGAVFLSVAQNVFQNKLASSITSAGHPEVNFRAVLALGATQFRQHFSGAALQIVMDAYNRAITNCFYVAAALSAISFVCAAFVPWNSFKKTKTGTAVI